MTLLVEQAALIMTVQDQGRSGFLRFGLPESGPMDWWAFQAANTLVKNPQRCACLEVGFSSAVLRIESDLLLAGCGAGYRLFVNDRQIPLWMAIWAHQGDRVFLEKVIGGNWIYLAVSGGLSSQVWMGSRSVYTKGGLGRSLVAGDRIELGQASVGSRWLAGCSYPASARPAYAQDLTIGVIPGPQQERFTDEAQTEFWRESFTVTSRSDRMGYRLQGPALTHRGGADLVSQGIIAGEIQVPPDGQPIVMMADHPTTGGYACIGTVCRVDLPLMAQAQPESSRIKFTPIGIEAAQERLSTVYDHLNSIENPQEDLWMTL
jgi:antagonist of KipI